MGADTAPLRRLAGRYGAKKVFTAEGADFDVFRSGAYTDAAMAAITAADPAVVCSPRRPTAATWPPPAPPAWEWACWSTSPGWK